MGKQVGHQRWQKTKYLSPALYFLFILAAFPKTRLSDCELGEVGPEPGDWGRGGGGGTLFPRHPVSTERSACTNDKTYHVWTVYGLPSTVLSFLHTSPRFFSQRSSALDEELRVREGKPCALGATGGELQSWDPNSGASDCQACRPPNHVESPPFTEIVERPPPLRAGIESIPGTDRL